MANPYLRMSQPVPASSIDWKQSSVVTPGELQAYVHLSSTDDLARMNETARKEYLRKRSQDRYKHWGNTIEALREKKKRDRAKRMIEIEVAQQKLDEEEAAFQDSMRQQAIERANRMLYLETDKVKTFNGGLLLATSIKEREEQINRKASRAARERAQEELYAAMMEEERKKLERREEEEARRQKEQGVLLAKTQLQQLAEVREKLRLERMEEIAEGEKLKRMAQEAVAETRETEIRRQERMREANQEFVRANEEHKRLREENARRAAEEEAKIADYASEKERVLALRREHEDKRQRAKLARHASLIEKQANHLAKIKEAEAARLDQQERDLLRKQDERIEKEERNKKELLDEMLRSREQQLRRKAEEKDRTMTQEKLMNDLWKRRNKEMEAQEDELERVQRQNSKSVQRYQREQVLARKHQTQQERIAELEAFQQFQEQSKKEDASFEQYAQEKISELQVRGIPTAPLTIIKARLDNAYARSIQPAYPSRSKPVKSPQLDATKTMLAQAASTAVSSGRASTSRNGQRVAAPA